MDHETALAFHTFAYADFLMPSLIFIELWFNVPPKAIERIRKIVLVGPERNRKAQISIFVSTFPCLIPNFYIVKRVCRDIYLFFLRPCHTLTSWSYELSSAHFLAHLSRRLTGELIVYPCSVVRPSVVRHPQFQRSSPLKPLGQSKSNLMWSILRKGERKFI